MDVVKEVLEKHQRELDRYKPIIVEKHLEVRNDIGMLLCSDPNDLDEEQLKYVHNYKKIKIFKKKILGVVLN